MTTRCGFVALLGAPNAGKSTLLNRLIGTKLSIVTPKPQTTRFRVLGIMMREASQVLLVDTPGIFPPRRRLDRAMVAAAWSGARSADFALLLVDARRGATDAARSIALALGAAGLRCWLALNKIDLVPRPRLLPLAAAFAGLVPFERTFMISAATGDGCDALACALAEAMPEGPHLYPPDDLTDLPDRLLAAELVREQVLLQTHEEVPHHVTVETERWHERTDGAVRVDVCIQVARPSQKAILVGAGGRCVREIGRRARARLSEALGRPVHLFLNVKEHPGWDEDPARLRAIGLEDSDQNAVSQWPRSSSGTMATIR